MEFKVLYLVYKSSPPDPTLSHLNPSHALTPEFCKSHFSKLLPFVCSKVSKLFFTCQVYWQILYAFLVSPCVLHVTSISFDRLNNIWLRVQIMKLFVICFSPSSCFFLHIVRPPCCECGHLCYSLRYQVLVAVKLWIIVLWVLLPCVIISGYQLFGSTYRFHLQDSDRGNPEVRIEWLIK
jgi:hypothetical protein